MSPPAIPGKQFSKGIPEADYYEGDPEGLDIFTWSPEPPGTPNVKPVHVHLHIPLAFGRVLMRFKSPRTLDRLIDALIAHREDVWGKR